MIILSIWNGLSGNFSIGICLASLSSHVLVLVAMEHVFSLGQPQIGVLTIGIFGEIGSADCEMDVGQFRFQRRGIVIHQMVPAVGNFADQPLAVEPAV